MDKYLKNPISLSGVVLALSLSQPVYALPTTIYDNYIGGDDHGHGDVIGSDVFDVLSMDVELLDNNILSVVINTNFAGKGDEARFSTSTYSGNGIGYGDLFLSDTWSPVGDAPYLDDNYYAEGTTDWSLAFSLGDERWTDGGTGSLYSLDGNDDDDILLSEDFLSRNTFRNGQEMAVNTEGKEADYINSSLWTVDDANNTISFLIDLTGTSLEGSDTIALHWGMTCANDTIEGVYSVPEPEMLGLLAIGLLGIGFGQRKKTTK